MDSISPRLPTVLGSSAALVVALISLYGSSASTRATVSRALAAFGVFAAFGIVIRSLLAESVAAAGDQAGKSDPASNIDGVDEIEPGTSVEDLLTDEERGMAHTASSLME